MAHLVVSGTGILGVGHITLQTLGYIQRADVVFYLVPDPVTEQFILEKSRSSRSLYGHYAEGEHRKPSYDGMVEAVLTELNRHDSVCVLFYGHPGVFVDPSHRMIRIAAERGHSAVMLAGVSSMDCLFSDVGFDPGPCGFQAFEATDFLLRRRRFDEYSYLVLLQVGVIGDPTFQPRRDVAPNLHILTDYLLTKYPPSHEVIIYEAAQYVVSAPRIERVYLSALSQSKVNGISTLLVPPVGTAPVNHDMFLKLGMSAVDYITA